MEKKNKKIVITDRDEAIFEALIKYHLTGEMIFEISKTFKTPFSSVANARARLSQLHKAGFLRRDERLQKGRSCNENYYFMNRKSASFFEDLAHRGKKDRIFMPISIGIQRHGFLISEVMVKMEKDIHEFGDICQMSGFIRENGFDVRGHEKRNIKPDGTIFLKINGENRLLFFEADRSTTVSKSKNPKARTIERKIAIYSEFKKYFHLDETISIFPGIYGYRVLMVCETEERMKNLVKLAMDMGKGDMFCFTTKERLQKGNMLFDRIWTLTDGELHSIF